MSDGLWYCILFLVSLKSSALVLFAITSLMIQPKLFVVSLILACMDYCNSLLAGLPQSLVCKLQGVQNCAAHLVVCAPPHVHVTPILRHLHWLPIRA